MSPDAVSAASRDLGAKLDEVGFPEVKEGVVEPGGPMSHLPDLRGGAPAGVSELLDLRAASPDDGVPELKRGPAVELVGFKASMLSTVALDPKGEGDVVEGASNLSWIPPSTAGMST